jgi:polyhydroxyalkanoate synthesis regulator phasin
MAMIAVMNRKITLDVLAGMIQAGFLDMARRMDSLENRIISLEFRVDALEKRMGEFEMRMNGFEKHMNSLEERMENGFYNMAQDLQQIRKLIAQTATREEVHALELRVDIIEQRLL